MMMIFAHKDLVCCCLLLLNFLLVSAVPGVRFPPSPLFFHLLYGEKSVFLEFFHLILVFCLPNATSCTSY